LHPQVFLVSMIQNVCSKENLTYPGNDPKF
jgi:hypothetical protein